MLPVQVMTRADAISDRRRDYVIKRDQKTGLFDRAALRDPNKTQSPFEIVSFAKDLLLASKMELFDTL